MNFFYFEYIGSLLKGTASIPFDPVERGIWEVAQGVQAAAKGNTATGRGSVGVLVVGIEGSVVVEILLDMNQRDVVPGEELSNPSGVGRLVARDIVAIESGRETSHVKS